MDQDYLDNLTQNSDFIPGIYNYCNRWCEKCSFTARCMYFAMSEEEFINPDNEDLNDKEYWERLHGVFKFTLNMLKDTAEKEGINLDDKDREQSLTKEEIELEESIRNNECVQLSKEYDTLVKKWFSLSGDVFQNTENYLHTQYSEGLSDIDPMEETEKIMDEAEMVRWYQCQIYVKLARAVRSSKKKTPEILEDMPRDADGSAKVALLGMDSSINAWKHLTEYLPGCSNTITELISFLEVLRNKTEIKFPEARSFVRPGFDDLKT